MSQGKVARDARLDAAKFGLIVLVIFGHTLELLKGGSPLLEQVYRFIYMFHMPAFVFLSGMVSSEVLDARAGRRLIASVLLPLLLFQALLPAWAAHLNDADWKYSFVSPYWILWYLASLFLWKLMLPVLRGSGIPLLLGCFICLGAGLLPEIGYAYSLSRTATFLPFFVAGYIYSLKFGVALPSPSSRFRLLGGTGALLIVWMIAKETKDAPIQWLYGSASYVAMGMESTEGLLFRSLLLIAGAIGLCGFFSLVPNSKALAALGRYSIAAFLLHAFVMRTAQSEGWLVPLRGVSPPLSLGITMIFAIILAVVLCMSGRILKPIFEFGWLWTSASRLRELWNVRFRGRLQSSSD